MGFVVRPTLEDKRFNHIFATAKLWNQRFDVRVIQERTSLYQGFDDTELNRRGSAWEQKINIPITAG
jgi:hypothetical protein